jgi:DNA polymerase
MDVRKRRYLAQMGIPVWQRRRVAAGALPPTAAAVALAPAAQAATTEGHAAASAAQLAGPAARRSAAAATPPSAAADAAAAILRAAGADVPVAASPTAAGDSAAELWNALQAEVAACTRCVLHRGRKQTVFGVGRRDAALMIIGEAPGAEEDRQGEPFVGPAGQLLNAMLRAIGFAREDVFIANVLKCRPPNNRDPGPAEAAACSEYLERQIALIRPQAMLAVGRIAAQRLLQSETPIGRLRGTLHRYRDVPLVVTYHPAYLLRTPSAKAKSWQDLCMIRQLVHIQS